MKYEDFKEWLKDKDWLEVTPTQEDYFLFTKKRGYSIFVTPQGNVVIVRQVDGEIIVTE